MSPASSCRSGATAASALLCPPGSVTFNSRFPEMVAEEVRKGYFRIFETREPAVEWLEEIGDEAGGG